MHIFKATKESRALALRICVPVADLFLVEKRHIWVAPEGESPEEAELLEYYDRVLHPQILQLPDSDGLSCLARDRARTTCMQKGAVMWPSTNQVTVAFVLGPPSWENETSETLEVAERSGPNLRDGKVLMKSPPSQMLEAAVEVGALKPSKMPPKDAPPPESRMSPNMRSRLLTLLEAFRLPLGVVTGVLQDGYRSSVKSQDLDVGDALVLHAPDFFEVLSGAIPFFTVRNQGKRDEGQDRGEEMEQPPVAHVSPLSDGRNT